jgi:hypothetical protein
MQSQTQWTPTYQLQRLNRTELYQLCMKAELLVHPASPKEHLIKCLTGEYLPPPWTEEDHPAHRWRFAIINFISEYWSGLHAQLRCPARNLRNPDPEQQDPRPCFKCMDHQVLSCVADNRKYEDKLRRHLPIKEK